MKYLETIGAVYIYIYIVRFKRLSEYRGKKEKAIYFSEN